MSVPEWQQALCRAQLSANARHVGLVLALSMTAEGTTQSGPSLDLLAEQTGRSVATVKRGLAELVAADLLQRVSGGGRGLSSVYRASLTTGEAEQVEQGVLVEPEPPKPRVPVGKLFAEFYDETYPRKVGRKAARRAFEKAIRDADPAVILAGARRLASDPNLPEKQFIPHPATWLNQGRWDDEPLPVQGNGRPIRDRALEVATGAWREEVADGSAPSREGGREDAGRLPGT